jgi:hypothetical protein
MTTFLTVIGSVLVAGGTLALGVLGVMWMIRRRAERSKEVFQQAPQRTFYPPPQPTSNQNYRSRVAMHPSYEDDEEERRRRRRREDDTSVPVSWPSLDLGSSHGSSLFGGGSSGGAGGGASWSDSSSSCDSGSSSDSGGGDGGGGSND